MKRCIFLTLVGCIAFTIGCVALFFPSVLLESKGIINNPPANVWMSEVGILLIAVGILVFLIRKEENSLALKAIFISITIIQTGLLGIELLAYRNGIITEISGIIPNCTLHLILILGFIFYLSKMTTEKEQSNKEKRTKNIA